MTITDLMIDVAGIISKSPHKGVQDFAKTLKLMGATDWIDAIIHLSPEWELFVCGNQVRLMIRHEGVTYYEHRLLAVLDGRGLSEKHFNNKLAALIHLTLLPQPHASGSIYYLMRPLSE